MENINLVCQYDKNDKLSIKLTDNFDNQSSEDKELIQKFVSYSIEAMKDTISATIDYAGAGTKVAAKLLSEQFTIISITNDFIDDLKTEQQNNPEDGIKNYASAFGKALGAEFSDWGIGKTLDLIPIFKNAKVLSKLGTKISTSIATQEMYDKYIKDNLGNWTKKLISDTPGIINDIPELDSQYNINYQGNIDPLAQIGNSLFLGDESIAGNAVCLADPNSPSAGEHTWKLTTSTYGKEYILTRLDENDKPSVTGTKLIIAPVDQGVDSKGNKITTTQNCVVINNFPFSQSIKAAEEAAKNNGVSTTVAPFGIKLGYLSEHSKFIVNEPSIEINNYSAVLLNDKKDNTVSTIYDNLSCNGAVLYKWAGQGADYEAMVLDKNGLKVKDKDAIALIPPSNSLLREIRPLTDDGRWIN